MAIIKCPYCKKSTVSGSEICLNCGKEINLLSSATPKKKSYKKFILVLLIVLFMIVAVIISYLFLWGKYIFIDKLQGLWLSSDNKTFLYFDDTKVYFGTPFLDEESLITVDEGELFNVKYNSFEYLSKEITINRDNILKFGDNTFTTKDIDNYTFLNQDESTEFLNAITESLNAKAVKDSLEISDPYILSSYSNSYITAKATITNNSSKTVYYVKVKANFLNELGTTIDTNWTYAVGGEGLAPNESKRFDLMIENSRLIDSVEFSILDYNVG